MSISHPSCPLNLPLDVLNFTLQLPSPSFCEIALVQLEFSVMSLICIERLYKAQSQRVCPGRDNFGNVHNIRGVKRMQRHFLCFCSEKGKWCFSLTSKPSSLLLLQHLWSLPSRCQWQSPRPPVVIRKNASRPCQVFLGRQNCFWLGTSIEIMA